jgi:ElaB/YqjD/DUF883 family membrane-anchored ribosome-binding protein
MNIKDILTKVAKGEELSDAEKAFAQGYDPDQETSNAAAARRKAEAKAAELQAMVDKLQKQVDDTGNAGKTEVEKAQGQIKTLSDQLAAVNKRLEEADKKVAAEARNGKLSQVMKEAGIQFVPGFDHDLLRSGFARAFEAIGDDDLANANVIAPIVAKFKDANKAAIVAPGHGGGTPPHAGGGNVTPAKNPWAQASFNLTEQAKVLNTNPAEAARLAAEAGVKIEQE